MLAPPWGVQSLAVNEVPEEQKQKSILVLHVPFRDGYKIQVFTLGDKFQICAEIGARTVDQESDRLRTTVCGFTSVVFDIWSRQRDNSKWYSHSDFEAQLELQIAVQGMILQQQQKYSWWKICCLLGEIQRWIRHRWRWC